MEPCSERLSGNLPCVRRILRFNQQSDIYTIPRRLLPAELTGTSDNAQVKLRIRRVFQGVSEPDDFVRCQSQNILRDSEIEVYTVRKQDDHDQLEKDCLRIARKGHPSKP